MPCLWPVWIADVMRKVLFSRIRLAMAGVDHQHFVGRHPAAADLRQQRLRQHADDRHGQLRADLLLLAGGKDVDDAVDRALGAGGVQRGEDDVAGFGRRDRRLDRLQVAHFADQDHVRVLPQGAANGLGEAGHVDAQFPLVDRRFLVRVVELDRVLDRDDVVVEVLVDVIDHRRQGGGLAGAGRPGDQNQPARPRAQVGQHRRRAQLLEVQQLGGNLPQHHGHVAALLEDRDAEAGRVAKGEAEVGAADFLQFLLAPLGRDALHQAPPCLPAPAPWSPAASSGRRCAITGGWPTVMCRSLALRLTTVWSSLSIRIVAICL